MKNYRVRARWGAAVTTDVPAVTFEHAATLFQQRFDLHEEWVKVQDGDVLGLFWVQRNKPPIEATTAHGKILMDSRPSEPQGEKGAAYYVWEAGSNPAQAEKHAGTSESQVARAWAEGNLEEGEDTEVLMVLADLARKSFSMRRYTVSRTRRGARAESMGRTTLVPREVVDQLKQGALTSSTPEESYYVWRAGKSATHAQMYKGGFGHAAARAWGDAHMEYGDQTEVWVTRADVDAPSASVDGEQPVVWRYMLKKEDVVTARIQGLKTRELTQCEMEVLPR